ncbi:SelT/SelW/SelH family protein [Vulcanisaeta thermophila]|uniref:SelT/SelW/SelH family protein n=1 Tax=Vulcanisaeta thermophila TaxID=867917 RepID=UPI000853ADD9|nr:Rdx family protein [Vulcanisaeta thermophila]
MTTNIKITYCRPCGFQGRAIKLADDLLRELGSMGITVTLEPGSGGVFDVYVNNELIFSRHREGRFPESSELVRIIKGLITSAEP